ncbi:bifunctional hexulose-6-phosphate synthase/ribonuclease regulator, partial [archaeon SCG-AAA382B04]
KGIRKVSGKKEKVFGKARTVKTISGDWAKPVEALEKTEPGDILVINAGGDELAVWGELATNSAINKGVKAIIIDGGVRDISDIRDLGFPVWAKYITPEAGEPKGYGEIGSEIRCGGVKINNGDYILADEDGVVVIDKKEVDEMLNRAQMVYENEERVREEIKNNSTLSEVLELDKWEEKK